MGLMIVGRELRAKAWAAATACSICCSVVNREAENGVT